MPFLVMSERWTSERWMSERWMSERWTSEHWMPERSQGSIDTICSSSITPGTDGNYCMYLPSVYMTSPNVTKSPRPSPSSPSVFVYCKQSKTGNGLGIWLLCRCCMLTYTYQLRSVRFDLMTQECCISSVAEVFWALLVGDGDD